MMQSSDTICPELLCPSNASDTVCPNEPCPSGSSEADLLCPSGSPETGSPGVKPRPKLQPSSSVRPDLPTRFEVDIQDSLVQELLTLSAQDNEDMLSMNQELESILDPKNTLRTPPPSVDLSPLECHALQVEESEALRAIFDEDLRLLSDSGSCFVVSIKFLSDHIKEEDVIKLWFSLPPNYPCVPPVFEIEANRSGSFSYRDADELFELLMTESINRVGGTMLFDLISIAQEFMPDLIERKRERDTLDRRVTAELEEAMKKGVSTEKLEEDEEEDEEERYLVSQAVHKPVHFVGPITDIIKKLPENMQIVRIENILRQDLAVRFQGACQEAAQSLWRRERQNPQMYSLKPQIAFHGTVLKSLPSIVHHGLVIPGEGNKVKVRCGSTYGKGIYLSPSADFSLGYSESNRLIVCAALMGRVIKSGENIIKRTGPASQFFTFLSPCEMEWVFFNPAQVLPCYVIQVAMTTKKAASHNPPPLSSLLGGHLGTAKEEEEDKRQRQAKLIARARKFLPYGFGPGSRTEILDAASFDDDEEDYGDYQLLRHQESEERESWCKVGVEKASELQKYRFRDPYARTESIEDN